MYESVVMPERNQAHSPFTGIRAYSAQDLELLHHYTVNANTSLASSIGLRAQEGLFSLPSIAFRFEFVLRAILALAALHLDYVQSQRPDSRIDYTAIAAGHINDALPAYRLALHSVTQENCTALLMFSSLLSIYVLAMSRNGMNPFHHRIEAVEQDFGAPALDLVSWLRLITGGMTAIRPWVMYILTDSDIGPCLNSELWTIKRTPETSVQLERDKILADLEHLWMNVEVDEDSRNRQSTATYLSKESKAVLSEALQSLRRIYLWVAFRTDADIASSSHAPSPSNHDSPASASSSRALLPLFVTSAPDSSASTPCSQSMSSSQSRPIELSAILQFLHGLTDGFLLLLHQRHPCALIIMAHYAVVLQQKDVWWLRGLGEDMLIWVDEGLREQSTTANDTDGNMTGERWLHCIEWPRSFFENIQPSSMDPALVDASIQS